MQLVNSDTWKVVPSLRASRYVLLSCRRPVPGQKVIDMHRVAWRRVRSVGSAVISCPVKHLTNITIESTVGLPQHTRVKLRDTVENNGQP
jgi:hypothetical protein